MTGDEQRPSHRIAVRFIVTGKVQGVFFRASTREQALVFGLSGRARNCDDGSVEVLAIGETAAIDALADWLRRGPPLARVESVQRIPASDHGEDDFQTG